VNDDKRSDAVKPRSQRPFSRLAAALVALAGVVGLCAAAPAAAQSWPTKPVRIVVTIGPGSSADILARIIGDELGRRIGQAIVVDNRPGAGGNIAADLVAKAEPDGHTLLLATISTHAINAAMYPSMPFDPVKDFAPIALLAANPNVLVVHPTLPVTTLKDLLDLAAKKPGELTYASGGAGTSQHLSGEVMATQGNVKLTHVPYKSTPESMNAVLSGQVTMAFASVPVALAQVKAGKLKALGVTSEKPLPWWAEMPSLASQGLPGFNVSAWFGMAAPARTPEPVIARLNTELLAIMALPAVREKLQGQGMEVLSSTPAQFGDFIRAETERWAKVVRASGAKVN
jgi:tripartite-type tricarboxylate transporter receptor subunit TctC